jgi:membrane protein implicated in regulation of membrane protease activity
MEVFHHLGAWSWMILAAMLFVLELVAPGIFFMWFGLAAAVTGLIAFGFDVSWQWQLIWFGLLSLAAIFFAIKYLRKYPFHSDRPLLNERAVQHIGEVHPLVDAIANGRGSVRIGDSVWRVEGPALPQGALVKIVGADGTRLKVVPA